MKRPLVLMLVCFVLGEVCVLAENWLVLIIVVAVYVIYAGVSWKRAHADVMILMGAAFLFLLGGLCFQNANKARLLDAFFEDSLKDVTIYGTVEEMEYSAKYNRVYLKDVQYVFEKDGRSYQGSFGNRILVFTKEPEIPLGSGALWKGTVEKLEHAANPGGFDSFWYYRARNVDYTFMESAMPKITPVSYSLKNKLRKMRNVLRNRLEQLVSKPYAGTLEAMLFGEKSNLDPDIKKQYQEAGIAHIIAISGLHIALVGMTIFRFLRKCRCSLLVSAGISGSLIVTYAIFTGMSGSTKRAMIMLLVAFLGQVIGRAYDLLSAMALSAFLILLDSPFMLMDAGFLLSFGAILGIGVLYPVLSGDCGKKEDAAGQNLVKKAEKRSIFQKIRDSFLVSFSIQLMTLPVISYFYFEFPAYSVLLNIIVIPFLSVIVMVTGIGLGISMLFLPLGKILLKIPVWILNGYDWLCTIQDALPGAHVITGRVSIFCIVLYYIAVFSCIWGRYIRVRLFYGISVCFMVLLLVCFFSPEKKLRVTMLDVGQGDGLVFQVPGGHTYLVDAGSTSNKDLYGTVYENYLKAERIRMIDCAIITHSDEDHICAVREMIRQRKISKLVVPDIGNPDENYKELLLLAKKYGVSIVRMHTGQKIVDGAFCFTCLHPVSGFTCENANTYSTTLHLSYGRFSMLLTGDLQEEGEEEVLQKLKEENLGKYLILKVAHHGSKYSTKEEFLCQVNPQYAIISAGQNNRYGHPHKELLKRLKQHGVKIYQTTEDGAICIVTDGQKLWMNGYKKGSS